MPDDDDELDGLCDENMQPPPTPDEDVDGVVLFADIDPSDVEGIEQRVEEWKQVFHAE